MPGCGEAAAAEIPGVREEGVTLFALIGVPLFDVAGEGAPGDLNEIKLGDVTLGVWCLLPVDFPGVAAAAMRNSAARFVRGT
eukprot:scaffold183876_cov26-Tisochrysis_lutea.AAC.2